MFNLAQLKEISVKFNLKYETLLEAKRNKIAKVWLIIGGYDKNSESLVAYTVKGNDTIIYNNSFGLFLNDIKSFELEKNIIELDVDTLLEKISKFGIKSLKKEEKDFLDKA